MNSIKITIIKVQFMNDMLALVFDETQCFIWKFNVNKTETIN